jgi:hypothetical protein
MPAGFGAGLPFSEAVRQRARERSKQAGRVVIKLKTNHAGATALKQSSGGELPVFGRVTITESRRHTADGRSGRHVASQAEALRQRLVGVSSPPSHT